MRHFLVVLAFSALTLVACTTTAPPMSGAVPPQATADCVEGTPTGSRLNARCRPSQSDRTPMPTPTASCNPDAAKPRAVGQMATAAIVEQARIDAGARTARVLKPGQMVTMEYAEGRLNIDVDARNVITNLRCG